MKKLSRLRRWMLLNPVVDWLTNWGIRLRALQIQTIWPTDDDAAMRPRYPD